MHRSPSEEASERMFIKTAWEWGTSGAMILRACRKVAKHTPFLLLELGPRNAATEEELRNAREKIRPHLIPENGP